MHLNPFLVVSARWLHALQINQLNQSDDIELSSWSSPVTFISLYHMQCDSDKIYEKCERSSLNNSQLAKLKKSIPFILLSWNLKGRNNWSKTFQYTLKIIFLCVWICKIWGNFCDGRNLFRSIQSVPAGQLVLFYCLFYFKILITLCQLLLIIIPNYVTGCTWEQF